MEERRLKFFLALQDEVEKSKNLSLGIKEKFYSLAENYLDESSAKSSSIEENSMFKTYKENGFIAIETDDLEVSVKSKKKSVVTSEQPFDLNHHKPENVTAFLSLFGSSDHPFKYLVHDYIKPGETFDLESFNAKVGESFKIETIRFRYSLPKYLYSRVEAFIGISTKMWFFLDYRVNFSFRAESVKNWSRENPNIHPLFGFKDQIQIFKDSIRVDGNLKELINYILANRGILTSFDIECVNLDNAAFYTDVDALVSGLIVIFNSIKQRVNNSSKLKISFEGKATQSGRLRILKIIHLGSNCSKNLKEDELFSGDLKDAKKFLYQLCDWSIIANNPDPEVNKINILFNPSKNLKPREKVNEPIEGFTHILTFYS
jgi:hypothetical protein